MLAEAYKCVRKVYLAIGYTDLRKGIDGLAQIIGTRYSLNPYDKDVLFLFCGKRCDRIKALHYEKTGFILYYKRLDCGSFQWPRKASEARPLTRQEFRWLMESLDIDQPKAFKPGTVGKQF